MDIEICKWYNNADSPVLFMIDDLANVWVDSNNNGKIDLGEDWGYGKNDENSSFKFLTDVILKDYIDVKVTFFTPVGVRVGMIENPKIKSISKMINCDEETKEFFRSIHNNDKYEIAYHGTTHGEVGETNNDFKQEWELFRSLEEAQKTISYGKEIYKDVFGEYPKGGKYCGYETNEFSDQSIDSSEFQWWCRYWNRGAIEDVGCSIGGNDTNPLTNYDIKMFGNNGVVDIPSTVNGGLLTGILTPNCKSIKGILKVILRKYLLKKKLRQLDYLLENKLVISIQEHIAHSRDDGRRQAPNIFDDEKSLKCIFNHLKNKNVWYCKGNELAQYIKVTKNIRITVCDKGFEITTKIDFDYNVSLNITIMIENYSEFKEVISPNGNKVEINEEFVNIPFEVGKYIFR